MFNLVDNHKGRKIDRKGRLKIDKPDSKILESFKETQSEDILIFNLLGESEGEKYKNLVSYRNILTHVNTCNIELDLNGNATIPKPKFFKTDYANQTWSRQSYSSEKWGTYKDICNTVYKETIAYINDIYDKIITRLDSIKDREDFIRLRGQIPPQIVQDARGIASGAKGPQGAIIQ